MKATRLPLTPEREAEAIGKFRLFQLEPPLPWHAWGDQENPREEIRWVLASDAKVPQWRGWAQMYVPVPETIIVRSTSQGEWINGEALASTRGEFGHSAALRDLGVTEIVDEIEGGR